MKQECVACNEEKNSPIIEHHVSYFPPIVINVHRSCHQKIHHGVDYQQLLPTQDQITKYYKNKSESRSKECSIYLDFDTRSKLISVAKKNNMTVVGQIRCWVNNNE